MQKPQLRVVMFIPGRTVLLYGRIRSELLIQVQLIISLFVVIDLLLFRFPFVVSSPLTMTA
jgi:hypothetical protein